MKLLDLQQGTEAWLAYRQTARNASEASMMMGAHKSVSRNELLRLKATGSEQEFSNFVRKHVLDKGHEVEALARPIIQNLHDVTLSPIVATTDDAYLSASMDGYARFDNFNWECKQFNKNKIDAINAGYVPEEDKWQVVQQCVVTGAVKCLYTVSGGTPENTLSIWYELVDSDVEALIAGWKQFDKDLENYEVEEIKQAPVAEVIRDLPTVNVQANGELTATNLDDVLPMFDKFLDQAVTVFETDQDFANAEAQSKVARATAKACKQTARSVVDQMLSVSEAVKTLEEYAAKFDKLGLQQEKAVKAEKENIKLKLANAASGAYIDHIAALEAEIAPIRLDIPLQNNHFMLQMKNKRTIASLKDAVDTALAKAKIEADTVAAKFRKNLAFIHEEASDYKFLFSDLQQIINNEHDAFAAIVKSRIAEHKEAEQKRLEAERERIAAEEKAKLEQETKAKLEAEQAAAEVKQEVAETPKQEVKQEPTKQATTYEQAKQKSHAFIGKEMTAPVTSYDDKEALEYFFGDEGMSELMHDENDIEYELQIIVKRVAIKQDKAA